MQYRSWLRNYATNWKVAGSIPYEVIKFFNLPNPSSRTMALGSTNRYNDIEYKIDQNQPTGTRLT
jgi:hypothetical protein